MYLWSPYASNYDNPIRYQDPKGDEPQCCLEQFMRTLLHYAGYSENTSSKTFSTNIAKELTKPETYGNAINGMGPVLGATVVGVATGGLGEGAFLRTSINTGVRTEVATAEVSTVVNLETRAKEIHSTLSPGTQSRNTTAVASATTAEGNNVTLVASNEKNLRPVQRAALQPGEIAVSGKGHAETTILNHASANGMQVNAVAASRPICPSCATAINNSGAQAVSPLKSPLYKNPGILPASTNIVKPIVVKIPGQQQ
jgi:hypothetical protein